jgi:MraZ protein|tara:strand:- start:169 stop:594 length:426 start_codon:yes stop_codon:yes gene_type:complete
MDAKGRIAMPTRYRDRLLDSSAGRLVVTIHLQAKCLLIYPLPVWEEIEIQIQELPALKAEVGRLQRLVLGYASDIELDGSGRMLLPNALRSHAQLDKKVVLVGQGKKLELWSEDLWNLERKSGLGMVADDPIPEELFSISF